VQFRVPVGGKGASRRESATRRDDAPQARGKKGEWTTINRGGERTVSIIIMRELFLPQRLTIMIDITREP